MPIKARLELLAVLLFAGTFALTPTSFFESGAFKNCVSVILFDAQCPGCGLTRAISSVLHGEFAKAFAYNAKIVIVFPLMTVIFARYVLRLFREAHLPSTFNQGAQSAASTLPRKD